YQDYFGSGHKLLTQIEFDYEILHRFGTVAVGAGIGYFSVSGNSPMLNGMPSGDDSTFKVIPLSVSAIYRFDYLLERRNIPLVPFGKLGRDCADWQHHGGNRDD